MGKNKRLQNYYNFETSLGLVKFGDTIFVPWVCAKGQYLVCSATFCTNCRKKAEKLGETGLYKAFFRRYNQHYVKSVKDGNEMAMEFNRIITLLREERGIT